MRCSGRDRPAYGAAAARWRWASLLLVLAVGIMSLGLGSSGAAPAEPRPSERAIHDRDVPRSGPARPRQDESPVDVELFSRSDCPQCARARAYLDDLQAARPAITVRILDVMHDADGLVRLQELAAREGVVSLAVPTFHVRGRLVVGWAGREVTGRHVEALLDGQMVDADAPPGEGCAAEVACEAPPLRDVVELPLLGPVGARSLGLPLFTVVVGLLDGFNPCAMWTLLLLLSLLVRLGSRVRMLLVAGTFVLVSGLVYYAFMAAWLNVFLLAGLTREIQVGLGLVAVVAGLISLKDVIAFRRGFSLSIPDSVKPRLYAHIGRILRAPGLPAMLVGVAALALLVNTVELLCTAGLPAVYTQVLVGYGLPTWQNYALLGLYQVFYMLDDSLMLVVAVTTLSSKRLQEREGRWLKLVSGAVLVALGGALVFRPELLYW
jgi:hypothetical protein